MWIYSALGASLALNIILIASWLFVLFWRYKWTEEEKEALIEWIESK